MPDAIPTPYRGATATVLPAWIDHNGHMNVGYYGVAFDTAAGDWFRSFGFTREFRAQHQVSTFALESHLHFVREVKEADPLRFEYRMIDLEAKRLHFYGEMFHGTEGYLAATYESLSICMDMRTRRTAPFPTPLFDTLSRVFEAHRALPRPWQVGHVISVRPPARGTG